MRNPCSANQPQSPVGFTLLEMTIVIMVLLALVSMGTLGTRGIEKWQAGKEASETLRSVYIAQRTYLADNPTAPLSSLTEAKLLPYIPNRRADFPKIKGLDKALRSINVNVSPPVVKDSSGTTYDPSGSPNDSLWDVGE